jgi:hypothetical protein
MLSDLKDIVKQYNHLVISRGINKSGYYEVVMGHGKFLSIRYEYYKHNKHNKKISTIEWFNPANNENYKCACFCGGALMIIKKTGCGGQIRKYWNEIGILEYYNYYHNAYSVVKSWHSNGQIKETIVSYQSKIISHKKWNKNGKERKSCGCVIL